MASREFISGKTGFVLGHGIVNYDRSSRINGWCALVGVTEEGTRAFRNIRPTTDDVPGVTWLSELGPGRLVFIPDSQEGYPSEHDSTAREGDIIRCAARLLEGDVNRNRRLEEVLNLVAWEMALLLANLLIGARSDGQPFSTSDAVGDLRITHARLTEVLLER